MKSITYENYLDKIWGGWVGKCAGGILGAPIEGFKCFHKIELSEKLFETNYPNDDLDLQVLWLDLVKQKGPRIDEYDMGEFWHEHVDFPWGEYGLAARNLKCGVLPPLSGQHNNDYWNRGMGSPIRSEIWGMLCAGDPEKAAQYAKMDSSIDHYGFSVEAEMFLSACEAIAFFESDIPVILKKAAALFPADNEIVNMYRKVVEFNTSSDYETTKGKIKSYFGDADFTSSPMNVAFAVHALLNFPAKMESVIKAVNLGHDSDCISATVGALLGTIIGYKNINPKWKEMIGDELLVSPQIKGINHASTISGLAKETAAAGVSFSTNLKTCTITGIQNEIKTSFEKRPVGIVQTAMKKREGDYKLVFGLLNYSGKKQKINLEFSSEHLELHFPKEKTIEANAEAKINVTAKVKGNIKPDLPCFNYVVKANNESVGNQTFQFGIPNYGEWLMMGPFIEDDKSLVPLHPKYPDHGLSSLPSIPYMNHDKLEREKEFLSAKQIDEVFKTGNFNKFPFLVEKISPAANQFELEKRVVGHGERTIYLATKIVVEAAKKEWVCFAGYAFITLFVNGKEVFRSTEIKRSWPMAFGELIELKKGENQIVFRLDCPVDDIKFQAGLKDFQGEHYHQSQWETHLIPTIN